MSCETVDGRRKCMIIIFPLLKMTRMTVAVTHENPNCTPESEEGFHPPVFKALSDPRRFRCKNPDD